MDDNKNKQGNDATGISSDEERRSHLEHERRRSQDALPRRLVANRRGLSFTDTSHTFVLFLLWNRMMVSCCFVDPQKSMGRVGIPTGMRVPKPRVISEFHRFAHDLRSGNITILDRKVIGRNGPFLHNSGVGSGRIQNPTRLIFTQKFFLTYWKDKIFPQKKIFYWFLHHHLGPQGNRKKWVVSPQQ